MYLLELIFIFGSQRIDGAHIHFIESGEHSCFILYRNQTLGKLLALGAAIEVGDVDQGRRLLLDRPGQVRVAVAEQVDRDAAGEIEIFLAILAIEIDPLARYAASADRRA